MARIRIGALRRALRTRQQASPSVHFHNGPQGQPAACFDEGCQRPRLDAG